MSATPAVGAGRPTQSSPGKKSALLRETPHRPPEKHVDDLIVGSEPLGRVLALATGDMPASRNGRHSLNTSAPPAAAHEPPALEQAHRTQQRSPTGRSRRRTDNRSELAHNVERPPGRLKKDEQLPLASTQAAAHGRTLTTRHRSRHAKPTRPHSENRDNFAAAREGWVSGSLKALQFFVQK